MLLAVATVGVSRQAKYSLPGYIVGVKNIDGICLCLWCPHWRSGGVFFADYRLKSLELAAVVFLLFVGV